VDKIKSFNVKDLVIDIKADNESHIQDISLFLQQFINIRPA
jgi:hypothetical protein